MKSGATLLERFEGWFVKPIEKLQELPEGDGGFLALSSALFLCERYFRTSTRTQDNHRDTSFMNRASNDLGMSLGDFKIFWQVYRNGIQHQGMPKQYIEKGITYNWSINDNYKPIPEIQQIDATHFDVRLNVWEFAEIIIDLYRKNPSILSSATSHIYGEVNDTPFTGTSGYC